MRWVEEEEAKLLVHVVGHKGARKLGNGGDGELGYGVHGGRALAREQARGRSERGDGERRGSEREWRGASATAPT